MHLSERFQIQQPFEQMELALVRALLAHPDLLHPPEEAVFRTALNLAKLYRVRFEDRDLSVGAMLAPFRQEVVERLSPTLGGQRPPTRADLYPLLRPLRESTLRTRELVLRRLEGRAPKEAVLAEVQHKKLVVVSGGGGGTGYVYLGALGLLEQHRLKPALMVGTSIGAILSLFRSRLPSFDQATVVNIVRALSWKKLFRAISTENRYGVPAALRLFLRAGVGRFFANGQEGTDLATLRLSQLPIPTIVAVAGIRRGMLPRPVEFYERLLREPTGLLAPGAWLRGAQEAMGALAEFYLHPEIMEKLHLGADPGTAQFDAVDAAGFSSALPGVIHYDVLRDDHRMTGLLDELFESKGLFRLVDGGLVDNLPAKAAWRAVHRGAIGTRNVVILALNAFSPRLRTPLWLPLQRLAELNVSGNRPYAHLVKDFKRTLSPLEVVPSPELLTQAIELGRAQLLEDIPLLARMLAPLPTV